MDILDDQGRLFGLVNVVDAIVLFLVAVVVVAGVAFVLQPEPEPTEPAPPETDTVTAVLDLGSQPDYIADRINKGDAYSPAGNSNLTITDVYVGPGGGDARVLLAVELEGPLSEDAITYDEAPLRFGRQLTVRTDDYQVDGRIRDVGTGLNRGTTRVVVNDTVGSSIASAIRTGDAYTLAGREIASVESVEVFATGDPDQRRVVLGLSLQTVDLGGGPLFGSTAIRQGAYVPFRTDHYGFSGQVRRVGAAELPGEPASRTVTLEIEIVNPEIANSLHPGMTETVAGQTNARVTAVGTRPATVLIRGQDGQLIYGEHPSRMDVTLTTELSVRETDTGPTFKGRSLQLGRTVHLDLGTVTIEATVVEIGDASP